MVDTSVYQTIDIILPAKCKENYYSTTQVVARWSIYSTYL